MLDSFIIGGVFWSIVLAALAIVSINSGIGKLWRQRGRSESGLALRLHLSVLRTGFVLFSCIMVVVLLECALWRLIINHHPPRFPTAASQLNPFSAYAANSIPVVPVAHELRAEEDSHAPRAEEDSHAPRYLGPGDPWPRGPSGPPHVFGPPPHFGPPHTRGPSPGMFPAKPLATLPRAEEPRPAQGKSHHDQPHHENYHPGKEKPEHPPVQDALAVLEELRTEGAAPHWVTQPLRTAPGVHVVQGEQFADRDDADRDALEKAAAPIRIAYRQQFARDAGWIGSAGLALVRPVAVHTETIERTAGANSFTVYRTSLQYDLSRANQTLAPLHQHAVRDEKQRHTKIVVAGLGGISLLCGATALVLRRRET